jgi:hypothetical protein
VAANIQLGRGGPVRAGTAAQPGTFVWKMLRCCEHLHV